MDQELLIVSLLTLLALWNAYRIISKHGRSKQGIALYDISLIDYRLAQIEEAKKRLLVQRLKLSQVVRGR